MRWGYEMGTDKLLLNEVADDIILIGCDRNVLIRDKIGKGIRNNPPKGNRFKPLIGIIHFLQNDRVVARRCEARIQIGSGLGVATHNLFADFG